VATGPLRSRRADCAICSTRENIMLMRGAVSGICLVLGLLVVLPGAGRAADEDKENPILASVKSRLKNPDKPFTLVVLVQVKEGSGEQFEAAFAKAITATRKEKGNLVYDLDRDTEKPSRYVVYERWKDLAALEAHLNSPHIKALLAELPKLTEGAPESRVLLPAGE
jgi:quinol monooxygenase YgiN